VRLEDSFLLTESGPKRLSARVPRTIEELEAFLEARAHARASNEGGRRRCSARRAAAAAATAVAAAALQGRRTVERLVVDVRVVDGAGQPVLGLRPEDFKVKLDGKPIALESALWVGGRNRGGRGSWGRRHAGRNTGAARAAVARRVPPSRGWWCSCCRRTSSRRASSACCGMAGKAEGLLGEPGPDDRVAALLFDTRLHALLDFTPDSRARPPRAARGRAALELAVQESDEPSLLAQLDRFRMKRAASAERALQLIGEALQPLPGPKTLVFFRLGPRPLSREGVSMTADYEPARHALQKARCFRVRARRSPTLDLPLARGRADPGRGSTGGFYAKTHLFPDAALKRMERALRRLLRAVVRAAGEQAGPAPARGGPGQGQEGPRCSRRARRLYQRSTRYSLCTKPRAKRARRDVAQLHVLRQRAEQWDALPDQHRHARDDQAVDQTGTQETLDRDPAVDVYVGAAASSGGARGSGVGRRACARSWPLVRDGLGGRRLSTTTRLACGQLPKLRTTRTSCVPQQRVDVL